MVLSFKYFICRFYHHHNKEVSWSSWPHRAAIEEIATEQQLSSANELLLSSSLLSSVQQKFFCCSCVRKNKKQFVSLFLGTRNNKQYILEERDRFSMLDTERSVGVSLNESIMHSQWNKQAQGLSMGMVLGLMSSKIIKKNLYGIIRTWIFPHPYSRCNWTWTCMIQLHSEIIELIRF